MADHCAASAPSRRMVPEQHFVGSRPRRSQMRLATGSAKAHHRPRSGGDLFRRHAVQLCAGLTRDGVRQPALSEANALLQGARRRRDAAVQDRQSRVLERLGEFEAFPRRDASDRLCSLLRHDQGSELYYLVRALEVFENLDIARVVEVFGLDLDRSEQSISRVQAHERMFAKLTN